MSRPAAGEPAPLEALRTELLLQVNWRLFRAGLIPRELYERTEAKIGGGP